MKNLFLVCLIALSVSWSVTGSAAWKTLGNTPWSEIQKNKYLEILWPSVTVGGVATTVNNVCSIGAGLKTIKPVQVCVKTETYVSEVCSGGDADVCRPVPNGYVPRAGERPSMGSRCVQYAMADGASKDGTYQNVECVYANGKDALVYPNSEIDSLPVCKGTYRAVSKPIPTTYYVEVIRANSQYREGGPDRMGSKKYSIGQCP